MVNHLQPDAVQVDQLNTRKRKSPARDRDRDEPPPPVHAAFAPAAPPDHALCAPAQQPPRGALSIDVDAAVAAASQCYRESAHTTTTTTVKKAAPPIGTAHSAPASPASARPAKWLRLTAGFTQSAPASPTSETYPAVVARRKARRRDPAARRRLARLYNRQVHQQQTPYFPVRFAVAEMGYSARSPQPSHQLGQSEVNPLSSASSSRTASGSSSSSSSSSASSSTCPHPAYLCDGPASGSRSAHSGSSGSSSRNCVHQSCVAFRFASMIDGVHLSSLSPQASLSQQAKRAGSFYVPPILPPINRYTLQELDLDAITKNPQLRHDLLFDVGLQFRPTDSKRKRETTDMYWRAVKSELEAGCSCVSFDETRHMHRHACACATSSGAIGHSQQQQAHRPCEEQLPIKVPSRVAPLIEELREVIYAVITPPPPPIRIRTNVPGSHSQNHTLQPRRLTATDETEVAWLREAFDVPLIEQQLRYGVFNPGKLLIAVSKLLREHCAPIRDPTLDTIMDIAKKCEANNEASLIDALAAIRLCFDLLELMRLDLANHLLAQLRPYLLASAPTFEASLFERRHNPTDVVTRAWIGNAYTKLTASSDLHAAVGAMIPPPENVKSLAPVQKIVATVLTALVDLVVFPPNPISAVLPPSPTTTPVTKGRQSYHINVQAGYPETLYLDHSRLLMLTADAADITANAMFLALFRQLVFSASIKNGKRVAIQDEGLTRLKSEINAVGPPRPGVCFCKEYGLGSAAVVNDGQTSSSTANEAALGVWRESMSSVALHLARAIEIAFSSSSGSAAGKGNNCNSIPTSEKTATATPGDNSNNERFVLPDSELIASISNWCKTNMHATSDVAHVFRKKVAAAVLKALIPRFFTLWNLGMGAHHRRPPSNGQSPLSNPASSTTAAATGLEAGSSSSEPEPEPDSDSDAPKPKTGLEPLSEEIRILVERLAKLAVLHIRVYLPFYDRGGFATPTTTEPDLAAPASTVSDNGE